MGDPPVHRGSSRRGGGTVAAGAARLWAPARMTIGSRHRRRRVPRGIVARVAWLRARFALGLRIVEERSLGRGIDVSRGTVRRRGATFGPALARHRRRRAPRPGDLWHPDGVRVAIRGRVRWPWRAVDRHGVALGRGRAAPPGQASGPPPARRAPRAPGLAAAADRDRPTGAAWRGDAGERARARAPGAQRTERPSRERPSAVPRARAPDGGLALARRPPTRRARHLRPARPRRRARPSPLRPRHPAPPPRRRSTRGGRSRASPPETTRGPRSSRPRVVSVGQPRSFRTSRGRVERRTRSDRPRTTPPRLRASHQTS